MLKLKKPRRLGPPGNTLMPSAGAKRLLYRRYIALAKKHDRKFDIEFDTFVDLTSSNCYYCGVRPSRRVGYSTFNGYYYYNGLDRTDNAVGYVLSNVVTCCTNCNLAKHSKTTEEFVNWFLRLIRYQAARGNLNIDTSTWDWTDPLVTEAKPKDDIDSVN